MHFRPLRSLTALALATAVLGLASPAAAGANDKDAQKLYTSAIDEDYLAAEFPKAEKKLRDALTKCGSGCSPELLGKIHVALGTVLSVGLSKNDDAKAEFVLALKADPKAALSADLTTPDLTKLFEEAKKSAGSSGSSGSSGTKSATPSGDAAHTPPAESQVNTPLPLYVEPADDVPLSKVTLRYKPFGASQYKSVELKKVGKGYGGEIPCEDTNTTGDVKYFFAFTGADGEAAGGLGSNKDYFHTTIKNEIEGEPPKLPGKKPPAQCKEKGDCPPGLPGCADAKGGTPTKHGDRGWKDSCEQTEQCKEGLACLNGSCEEDKGGGGGGGETPKKKMNLVSVGLQLDFLSLNGGTNVCSGSPPAPAAAASSAYACFVQGTSNQFFGGPLAIGSTNGIQGGGAFADVRILAGYDRQLVKSLGLTLGLRLGVAIGGSPTPANVKTLTDAMGNTEVIPTDPGFNQNISVANSFLRIHAEGRLSYFFFGNMLEKLRPRPYVFVAGGVSQVNASVPVTVCDSHTEPGDASLKPCPGGKSWPRQLNAYQITGLDFVGFGGGTTFGFTPNFGVAVELKFMFELPTFGVVISPTLGPVVAF